MTNCRSFSDTFPGQGVTKGHQRKPSEDFILGNVASLSTIQSSVDKMSMTHQQSTADQPPVPQPTQTQQQQTQDEPVVTPSPNAATSFPTHPD